MHFSYHFMIEAFSTGFAVSSFDLTLISAICHLSQLLLLSPICLHIFPHVNLKRTVYSVYSPGNEISVPKHVRYKK